MKNYILLVCLTLVSILCIAQNKLTETSFKVFGECEQCKSRIELAAKLKGVQSAVWDMDTKMLLLAYDPNIISLEKIQNKKNIWCSYKNVGIGGILLTCYAPPRRLNKIQKMEETETFLLNRGG